jgi:hypothetical protein
MTNATAQHKSSKRTGIVSKHNQVGVNNKGWFKCGGHVTKYNIE